MLSFEEPKKHKLELAVLNGPDFDKDTPIYLHRYATENENHIKDTHEVSDYLAHKYNNEITKRIDNETIKFGKFTNQVPGMITVYGNNYFSVSPDRNKDQTHFISLIAPPGSGKSTWIAEYIRQYIKKFPQGKILFFSVKDLSNDKALNRFEEIQQIDMNDEFNIYNPLSIQDINRDVDSDIPVLAIFDDCLAFEGDKYRSINHTLKQFVEVGRSRNITVIFTAHSMTAGLKTKLAYDNSTAMVFFLASNKALVEEQIIQRYKFSTKEARYLTKLPSRWLCFSTSAPECIVTEKNIVLLDDLRNHFQDAATNKRRK